MKSASLRILQILLLFSVFTSDAQDYRFGLTAGVGGAQILAPNSDEVLEPNDSYKPALSPGINAYLGYKSNGKLGYSIEPGIIIKGGIPDGGFNIGNDKVRYQLTYINLPLSLDYYLSDKFYISAGPEMGFLLSAKAKTDGSSFDLSATFDNEVELSGQVAVNYNVGENINLGLRYSRGLNPVAQFFWTDINGNQLGQGSLYNQYLHFLIRYKFRSFGRSS